MRSAPARGKMCSAMPLDGYGVLTARARQTRREDGTTVDLTGWKLADRAKQACDVSAGPLAPGDTRRVAIAAPAALGNGGGTITLLDAGGLKVAGVAYTGADAEREGWTVTF